MSNYSPEERRPSFVSGDFIIPILALFVFSCSTALAIPSPDLVINMFASASAAQLLGLGTALLGAGLMNSRRLKSSKPKNMRRWFYILLGLLLVSVIANIFQHSQQVDDKNERLQTNLWRSSVENGQQVGDVSLKTLGFSDQLVHPQALSTDTLHRWREQGKLLNIIDVRETEEIEQGSLADTLSVRYPDVRLHKEAIFKPNHENIFMCYSGNRSSELCTEFSKQGLDCKFLIGGFEKWIAEDRPLASHVNADRESLREIADYENRETLLDTKQVYQLLDAEPVQFIDVRYPGEFNRGHLPGAINLTIRALTTEQLNQAMDKLPSDKPVIAPCYDKRSCFYGQILGLKLSRKGMRFLGRYTTPYEFATTKASKAYVDAWQSSRDTNLMQWAAQPFKVVLAWLNTTTGSLVMAIILLVAAIRIVVAPITIKSDRDSAVLSLIAPEISRIKAENKDNPRRSSKKILAMYRKHRLTPGKNFIGTAVQIIVFMLMFFAVQGLSVQSTESFLWLALADNDGTYILPVLVSALIFFHCWFSSPHRTRLKLMIYVAVSALIFVLTINLSAATNIYLSVSILLLFFQAEWVRRRLAAVEESKSQKSVDDTYSDFSDKSYDLTPLLVADRINGAGNKAVNLSRMLRWGIPVPDGFVIPPQMIKQGIHQFESKILSRFDQLGAQTVVARSSGGREDGAENSHAGIYETRLNVVRQSLMNELNKVVASYVSERATVYSSGPPLSGSIVVQEQVNPDYAGVLFTENPAHSGQIVLEYIQGLADDLVSGRKTPKTVIIGRASGDIMTSAPPFDVKPLLALARKIEEKILEEQGRNIPQDIEWAHKNGQFFIIQTRDITTRSSHSDDIKSELERERKRLVDILSHGPSESRSEPAFMQNELSEVLPKPTPLSLSLMQKMWDEEGCVDLACQRLGINYEIEEDSAALIETAFGQLYINRVESEKRTTTPGTMAAFRLAKLADEIKQTFQEGFLPEFNTEMTLRQALDFHRLTGFELKQLLKRWINEFIQTHYMEAEVINIAAEFYMKSARQALLKKNLDPNEYLTHSSPSMAGKAIKRLYEVKQGKVSLEAYCAEFGHRSHHDYELSEPREFEDKAKLLAQVAKAEEMTEDTTPFAMNLPLMLEAQVKRALTYQNLKEEAKHYCMKPLASIRRLLLHLDACYQLDGKIFYLNLDELLNDDFEVTETLQKKLGERFSTRACLLKNDPPSVLSLSFLEKTDLDDEGQFIFESHSSGAIKGQRIAGKQSEAASIRVLLDLSEIDSVKEGEIIVVKNMDPDLATLLPKVEGLLVKSVVCYLIWPF